MTTATEGKHWAIECNGRTDYVRGEEAQTPKDAEKFWRRIRSLYFIDGVTVRRTTVDEDERLSDRML